MKKIQLRAFTINEIMINDEETKVILKYMFKSQAKLVDNLNIDFKVKSFAQALLLEAIDGSYALGFAYALFGAVSKPGLNAQVVITKFAKNSLKHWYKHANNNDLLNVKIYESTRKELDWIYGRHFAALTMGIVKHEKEHMIYLANYRNIPSTHRKT